MPIHQIDRRELSPVNPFSEFLEQEIQQCIPERMASHAVRHPESVAVHSEHESITYGELNRTANRLARFILKKYPPTLEAVALMAENDICTIAGIFGIMKAAKICVPLDPTLPSSRARFILRDSRAALIISSRKQLRLSREWSDHTIDTINAEELDAEAASEPGLHLPPDSLAYILYTSGSSGPPKGVADTHRNVLHHVMRITNASKICASDRLTLLRPPCVSGALMNVFFALLNGASLHCFDVKHHGTQRLLNWLSDENVTIYHSSASVFRDLGSNLRSQQVLPNLRLIRLGSEQVTVKEIDVYKRYFPDHCFLLNALSSTEGRTIRQYFINRDTVIDGERVPVGYKVEDIDILLLDDTGNHVDAGKVGEITIRSPYLFTGYWDQSDDNVEAFEPDPDGIGQRIFRTGDLGRMLPGGCLEYCGRKDSLVKIRGHRVATDELENALTELPGTKQAAVKVFQNQYGDQRLVAYIVPSGETPSTHDLRERLAQKFPAHFIPSTFEVLEELPFTATGKLDRAALPPPSQGRPKLDSSLVPPCTPLEEAITHIWREVLEIEQIGVHDNFLHLGGHSLLGGKIVAKINETFSRDLALRDLFENPTVAKISQMIADNEACPGQGEKIAAAFLKVERMNEHERKASLDVARKQRGHA